MSSEESDNTQPGAATRAIRPAATEPEVPASVEPEHAEPESADPVAEAVSEAVEAPGPGPAAVPGPDPAAVPGPEARWLTGRRVFHTVLVLAFMGAAIAHQYAFWNWYIEDAAISFAFARNWAWGEGLVAYPGGERLEGYSNFTWVVLLALGELLGIEGFSSSKGMQMVLGTLTVPLTYLLAREATPDARSHSPIAAAAYLGAASTFAIWNACGLENSLFNFLLAAALLRSAIEIRTGRFPWAAFLWFLIAITRPEAVLYCAVAGFLTMCFTLRPFGAMPTVKWLAAFFVPFGLYHAVRFSYFAYEFPQTYYGKLGNKDPKVGWNTRGWRYVRNWSHDLWTGYFLPLWIFGLVGTRGWRGAVAFAALAFTGFWLMYPTNEALDTVPWWPRDLPAPSWWVDGRSFVLIADALLLPLLALGTRRGWQVRVLVWGVASSVLFFSVYTLGDWMKSWRWMSLLQVPAAVLFALGAEALADVADRGLEALNESVRPGLDKAFWAVVQVAVVAVCLLVGDEFVFGRWWLLAIGESAMLVALLGGLLSDRLDDRWTWAGWTVLSLVMATAVLPNVTHTNAVLPTPETGPFAIKKRVEFVQALKNTLEIEGRMSDLDVDMGAHLWWGRDDFAMMDIAGLVDIPFAQHRFRKPFVQEYLFEERRPHFAHIHGGWASNSRIPSFPAWRTDYHEIPGYPAGRSAFHIGNHIRRDIVMQKAYSTRSDRRVAFGGGLLLEGFDLPSEPARARMMWIEIGVRDTVKRADGEDIQVQLVALKDGVVRNVWNVPLGYGWFSASDWRIDEVNVGRYKLPIPESMEEGTYDLAFVMMTPDGVVQSPLPELPEGAWVGGSDGHPAAYAAGEVVFGQALTVISLEEQLAFSEADRLDALEQARRGRCEQAAQAWFKARKHRPIDQLFIDTFGPNVNLSIATCWVWRAEHEPENAIAHLERARQLDHHAPAYLAFKDTIADPLYAQAEVAFDEGRMDDAYRLFSDVLRVDATRSWARRYAEQARAFRLGIDPESLAAEEAERERQRLEAVERREQAEAQRAKAPPKVAPAKTP